MGDKPLFNVSTIPRPKTVARPDQTHIGLRRRTPNPKPLTVPVSPMCNGKSTKPHNCLPPPKIIVPYDRNRTMADLRLKSASLVELPVANYNRPNTLVPVKHVKSEVGLKTKVLLRRPSSARTLSSCKSFISCASTSSCASYKDKTPRLATRVLERFVVNAWRKRRVEVDKLKAINQKLLREVEFLRVDVVVLRNDLKSRKREENESIFNDSIELKLNADKERETNKELLERIKALETEKDIWTSKEKRLKEEIQFLLVKRREVECVNFDLTQKCSTFEKLSVDHKSDLQKLQNILEDSERALKNKICELQNMMNTVKNMGFEKKKLTDRINRLNEDKDTMLKQNNDLVKKLKFAEAEVERLKNVSAKQQLQCDGLKTSLKKAVDEACRVEERLEAVDRILAEKDTELDHLRQLVEQHKTADETTRNKLKWAVLHAVLYASKLFPIASQVPF